MNQPTFNLPPTPTQEEKSNAKDDASSRAHRSSEVEGMLSRPTPANTAGDVTSEQRRRPKSSFHHNNNSTNRLAGTNNTQQQHQYQVPYGKAIPVKCKGSFPQPGSCLGPFFCLGVLGQGTFSSIHKCIHMDYPPETEESTENSNNTTTTSTSPPDATKPQTSIPRNRLVAAKVELVEFAQSGVLESEAAVLEYLHRNLPAGTVPAYMGHYYSNHAMNATATATSSITQAATTPGGSSIPAGTAATPAAPAAAALVMEFLPGPDMHQLREAVMTRNHNSRRINVQDAVFLTADVFLPLLQRLHMAGVVHRDVKPSNCVLQDSDTRSFCLVDFGLSKSIIVPGSSEHADKEHPWSGTSWMGQPAVSSNDDVDTDEELRQLHQGYYRQERPRADFRGTSMYASVRVHQLRDYCPRDDIWSLLYVFCDLVSGGLPWMSYAAHKDRNKCQELKKMVHGDKEGTTDHTELLLYGDHYHVAAFKRDKQISDNVPADRQIALPQPLLMSQDKSRVELLRKAFSHLATLQFCDMPDYELIRDCVKGFLLEDGIADLQDPLPELIDWDTTSKLTDFSSQSPLLNKHVPAWEFIDSFGVLDEGVFDESLDPNPDDPLYSKLPLEFQYRLAQLDHNLDCSDVIPKHSALSDWMQVVLPMLYGEWNARLLEEGGHRTSTDGFRRDGYLSLLERCYWYAEHFKHFQAEGFFCTSDFKRRKVMVHGAHEIVTNGEFVLFSRAWFGLQLTLETERRKKPPPPPSRLAFS